MIPTSSFRSVADPLTVLGLLVAILAVAAAGTGLLWSPDIGPLSATSVRGETVDLYGRGLYHLETPFVGAGARGTDSITLILALPLNLATLVLRHHGSLRASLLLTGALAWFLYVYASLALGTVMYNALFLVYVALFSTSLFGLALALREAHAIIQSTEAPASLPRGGPTALLFDSGLVTAVVWLGPLLSAVATGQPPERLDMYTGRVTDALDLAVITPSTIVAGVLVLRRRAAGFAVAIPLFVLEAFLLPMIAAQTVSQMKAGVAFSAPEVIGPVGGFVVLAGLSLWVLTSLLRRIPDRSELAS